MPFYRRTRKHTIRRCKMIKKIVTLAPEQWEIVSKDVQAFILHIEDKPCWIFKICPVHKNGLIDLLLCPIPSPNTVFSKLQSLTNSDWQLAEQKASALLAPFIPSSQEALQ